MMGDLDDNKWMRRGFLLVILLCLTISCGLGIIAVLLPEWITFECVDDDSTTENPLTSEHLRGKIGLWEICMNHDFNTNSSRPEVVCSAYGSVDSPLKRPEWMTQIVWQAMSGLTGNGMALLLLLGFTFSSVPVRRTGAMGLAATFVGIGGFYMVAMILSFSAGYHILDAVEEFPCVQSRSSKGTSFHLIGWTCAVLAVGCVVSLIVAGLASPTPPTPVYRKITKSEEERNTKSEQKYILPGALEFFNQGGYWAEDETDGDDSFSKVQ